MPLKILITGATGYIGSSLVRGALARGHTVIAASRRAPGADCAWLRYELGEGLDPPHDLDAIVHLAADTGGASPTADIELRAARALMNESLPPRVRLVFVSSQTARPDAPTKYGRDKWAVEKYVLERGGWVVRPGQVYGGQEAGLFGTMTSLVRGLPILPALVPAPHVQPIHVDDCAEGILRVIERGPDEHRILHLAAAQSIPFTVFLREIARSRLRKRTAFVPVPAICVRAIAGFSRKVGFRIRALERVLSLLDVPHVESAGDLDILGLDLRPLPAGMTRSGTARRYLLEEGLALLRYVLRRDPPRSVLTHYVRSVETIRKGHPLGLPRWMTTRPCLLGLIDAPSFRRDNDEFRWRIDAATAIAEASATGFNRFSRSGRGSTKSIATLGIAHAVVIEIWWRVLRIVVAPIVVRVNRQLRSPG